MQGQCLAILVILTVLVIVYLRREQKTAILCVLPLYALPVLHLLGYVIASLVLPKVSSFDPFKLLILIDVVAVAASALFIGLASNNFHRKRSKTIYSVCCMGYTCTLGLILVLDMLPQVRF